MTVQSKIENAWKSILVSHCIKKVGAYFYIPIINYNALFRFRQDGTEVTYLGSFLDEEPLRMHLYGAIAENNGILYMPPMNGYHIALYEIATGKFGKIKVDERYGDRNIASKFFGAVSWKNYVYFIPCRYRALVRLNTETGELHYIDFFIKKYWAKIPASEMLVKNAYFIKDGKLFLAGNNVNQIISINLETEEICLYDIPLQDGCKKGFMGMCADGDNIYLIRSYSTKIIRYSIFNKTVTEYETGVKAEQYPFINIMKLTDQRFAAVPYEADKSVVLDMRDGVIQTMPKSIQKPFFEECWKAENYFAAEIDRERYITCSIPSGVYTIIGKNGEKQSAFRIIDRYYKVHYLVNRYKGKSFLMREGSISVEDFIKFVHERSDDVLYSDYNDEIGKIIHEMVKNQKG